MLEVKGLKKNYGTFHLDCSFKVEDNQIVGLIGRNGAGKSTIFKSILNLIKSDAGEIKLFDKNVAVLSRADKAKIGVTMPDSSFSDEFTIADISKIMAAFYNKFNPGEFKKQCLKLGLPINKKTKDFSTGMFAKLKILLALSYQADFLLLDEPTSGLDVGVRQDILKMLQQYMNNNPSRSILISSHISTDLEELCDKVVLIDQGKVLLKEDADRISDEYGVIKVSKTDYKKLDKKYLLKSNPKSYGYACLTDQRQYYQDNYPDLAIEKSSIDDVLLLLTKGAN